MRRYSIKLHGHDAHDVVAQNASKAKAADFRAWREAGYGLSKWRCGQSYFAQYLAQLEHVYAMGKIADVSP